MKTVQFDHSQSKWDQYRAPYMSMINQYRWNDADPLMVLFDTGEAILTRTQVQPYARRLYTDKNIALLSPRDKAFPKVKTPDGQRVRLGDLTSGRAQHFLVDYDHGIAVALGSMQNDPHVPERLRKVCRTYYAGPKSAPIGAPVKLRRVTPTTPDERKHIANLRACCRAWMALSDEVDIINETVHVKPKDKPAYTRTWSYMYGLARKYILLVKDMSEMDLLDRCRLATHGTVGGRTTIYVSHLVLA